jgi:hypothetical protein
MGRSIAFRTAASFVAVVALAGLSGCGGSSPTNDPAPVPAPTPCAQKVLDSGSDSLPSKYVLYYDFSVPEAGRLDVTLDWTYASNNVGVYVVTAGTCSTLEEFNARNCNFVLRSETTAKPRKVSVANVGAGNYRWLFANFGSTDDSISYQVVLSTGGCAPLTNSGPGASAAGAPVAADALRPSRH